jgi:peroxiredoxin
LSRGTVALQSTDEIVSVAVNINPVMSKWSQTSRDAEAYSDVSLAFMKIFNIYIKLDVRILNIHVTVYITVN